MTSWQPCPTLPLPSRLPPSRSHGGFPVFAANASALSIIASATPTFSSRASPAGSPTASRLLPARRRRAPPLCPLPDPMHRAGREVVAGRADAVIDTGGERLTRHDNEPAE